MQHELRIKYNMIYVEILVLNVLYKNNTDNVKQSFLSMAIRIKQYHLTFNHINKFASIIYVKAFFFHGKAHCITLLTSLMECYLLLFLILIFYKHKIFKEMFNNIKVMNCINFQSKFYVPIKLI